MALKDNLFYSKKTLNINGNLLDVTRPKIMGILNVTSDSFYDGGRYIDKKELTIQAARMAADGADIIDVGGYSSRPGSSHIEQKLEIERVLEGIRAVQEVDSQLPISVDTFRAEVAQVAIDAGAAMINDISGGSLDSNMFQTIAKNNVSYVLMHMVGNPQNMTNHTSYEDLLIDMINYFVKKLKELSQFGIKDVIIDVGFGFSKTVPQNYKLISNLECFQILRSPMLVGLSRKSMIYKILKISPENALNGTSVLNAISLLKGANILRVHDVQEAREVINLIYNIEF